MAQSSRMIYQTEETRTLILERAAEMFANQGFFDAQMKDIAEAVSMSRHTLYRYFQNKVDLGTAIAKQILLAQSEMLENRLSALIEQAERTGLERLREFVVEDILRTMDGAEGRFLAEFDAYFSNHRAPPNFQESIADPKLARAMETLGQLIDQGRADGSLRSDLTLEQAIQVLTGVRAIQKEVVLRGELYLGMNEDAVKEMPAQLAEFLLAGMAGHPS